MEENKRKQYAHLYEHHEVEDPQPREEKEKPIGPSGRNRHRPMVEKVCRRIAFSFAFLTSSGSFAALSIGSF